MTETIGSSVLRKSRLQLFSGAVKFALCSLIALSMALCGVPCGSFQALQPQVAQASEVAEVTTQMEAAYKACVAALTDYQGQRCTYSFKGKELQAIVVSRAGLSDEEAQCVMDRVYFDTEYWWVMCYGEGNFDADNMVFELMYTDEQIAERQKRFESVVKCALSSFGTNAASYEKIHQLHDWLIDHAEYSYTHDFEHKTAYSALVGEPDANGQYKPSGDCQGFGFAMNLLLKRAGFTTAIAMNLTSISGGHCWNVVKLGPSWYHVDVTFDCTYTGRIVPTDKRCHKWLLGSDTAYNSDGHNDKSLNADGLRGWTIYYNGIESSSAIVCDKSTYANYAIESFSKSFFTTCKDEADLIHYHDCAELGHAWTTVQAVAPTCVSDGYTLQQCSWCGDMQKIDVQEAGGHSWGEGVVVVEPTCTTAGRADFACANGCGASRSEAIEALGHAWDEGVRHEPQDGSPSTIVYTCTRAGCGVTRSEEIGHTWDAGTVVKAATCTAEGTILHSCTDEGCGSTYTESIPATGHSWTVTTVPATCSQKGQTTYTCANSESCDYTETIEPLGHNMKHYDEAASTCLKQGCVQYWECERCQGLYADEAGLLPTNLEALTLSFGDHAWDEGTVDKKATCLNEGQITYRCTLCGETETLPLDALGHSWGPDVVTKATYAKEGTTTRTCTRCGYTALIAVTDRLAYKAGDTCKKSGITYKVLSASKHTVSVLSCTVKKSTATVPATVKLADGASYKVVSISAKAFAKASKVRTVVIKSGKLTKKGLKGSLKSSKVKAVVLKGAAKKKKTTYSSWLRKSNSGRSVFVKVG